MPRVITKSIREITTQTCWLQVYDEADAVGEPVWQRKIKYKTLGPIVRFTVVENFETETTIYFKLAAGDVGWTFTIDKKSIQTDLKR